MRTDRDIKLGVSLYSYQDNYYFKKHDLEGCIAAAAGAGAEGIEVFPDAMMPEWPYISDAFIDRWNGWMERYDVEPVCVDHFSDRAMWHDKQLTDDELYERSIWYIKTAHRLGAHAIRLLHDEHIGKGISPYKLTDASIAERLLPVCAKYDVMMALECHAPTNVADPIHQPYLDAAKRLGLPYIGLQADFSSYEYCISTADIILAKVEGMHTDVLNYVRDAQRDAYFSGRVFHLEDIIDKVEAMNPTVAEMALIKRTSSSVTRNFGSLEPDGTFTAYKTLKEYAPKLVYVHGKFYDIDESGQVDSMDYPKILAALKEGGYKGYICSEFEGNRRMNGAGWVDEVEYVRCHHVLMRQCLGYEA